MNKRKKMKTVQEMQPCRTIDWSALPSDIENNILSRLPVKYLMRFRCVCKHWCNLVTNPHFIKLQLNHSTQVNKIPKLIRISNATVYSIDLEACVVKCITTPGQRKIKPQKEIVLPFKNWSLKSLKIAGSCNGLLCFSCPYSITVHLLNPVTKEYKSLPYPKYISSLDTTVFGFGYSPRTDEYKVIIILYYEVEHSVLCDGVYVYTLGKDSSWRSIGKTGYRINDPNLHALVNGALHWMASGPIRHSSVPISFDFGDEKFREFSMPKSFRQGETNHPMEVEELGGFLSLHGCKDGWNFDIWVMKDYGDETTWTKMFSVAQILNVVPEPFKPLYILKKGEVLFCECEHGFFILDVVKKATHRHRFRLPPWNFRREMYFESLVSLRALGGMDGGNE
ncbi:F-box/kelch-repeat protein At3g23880-like [Macadamia integrifolia]|uniref:F-box/kelch-repeat protein At3g23880-like n=1 Tax=Macadamia integrifolia TaxID=60698 RepID=UPI001C4FABAB|nr:F-box/kelch-repeat protein At3g23880-like [Macadamia integrifolia]